jgi:hypothetical protein
MKKSPKKPEEHNKLPNQSLEISWEKIVNLLNDIINSNVAVNQNYRDLVACHNAYTCDDDIIRPENSKKLIALLITFSGRLRNYLASYCSLIDQIMEVRDNLKNVQLNKNYKAKLSELGMEEKSRFVGDLRNYCIHRRLPIARPRVSAKLLPPNKPEVLNVGEICKDTI